ncbi:MAG TPA: YifB family Mg chelatase-like AAA ATPase [Dongiaceae bacterium]|nr:YifB family Mg chelatase-like AAA ATPase [Dongiaceae bacterium]
MLARVQSLTLLGIDAFPLTVEVDFSNGLPGVHTVGLPDAAVRESAERVRAALRHAGRPIPPKRVTISLAPADLRKQGSALDLPIALAILAADGAIPATGLEGLLVAGELGLDGGVRSIRGALPTAVLARRLGLRGVLLPAANAAEARILLGSGFIGVKTLAEAIRYLTTGIADPPPEPPGGTAAVARDPEPDLSEVRGQAQARRALEVAAAGGHHLLMVGPPGCGKTMLARRLPGLLPGLTPDETIEVTSIYSVAGLLPEGRLLRARPFRAPHHTISGIGLVGGGRGPRPGEVTLAHRGVLFLDELPEFGRATLDVLRQPIEEGEVLITRENRTVRFPARLTLVAAMNPCPCGHLGRGDRPCGCTPALVAHYRQRVSGPLVDRFDLQVIVPPVEGKDLRGAVLPEPSEAVALRVAAARERQARRGTLNAALTPALLRRHAWPDPAGRRLLDRALRLLGLSARAHDGILRVARTLADLDHAEGVGAAQVGEAIQYRAIDRPTEGGSAAAPLHPQPEPLAASDQR